MSAPRRPGNDGRGERRPSAAAAGKRPNRAKIRAFHSNAAKAGETTGKASAPGKAINAEKPRTGGPNRDVQRPRSGKAARGERIPKEAKPERSSQLDRKSGRIRQDGSIADGRKPGGRAAVRSAARATMARDGSPRANAPQDGGLRDNGSRERAPREGVPREEKGIPPRDHDRTTAGDPRGAVRPTRNNPRQERAARPARAALDGAAPDRRRPDRPRPDRAQPIHGRADRAERPDRAATRSERANKAVRTRKDGSPAVGRSGEVHAVVHDRREPQRIAKLLARAGVASRREIERMIEERRIALDGKLLETPATIVTSLAGITVDGTPIDPPDHARLFLFNKPTGFLTAERDPAGRPTIYDRLPADLPRVVPVGRLDMNTEGLLLMTTDGGLKRALELPSSAIPRIYRARAYGEVTQDQLESLIEGVEIDGVRYGSIDANMERRTGRNLWIEMTLTEGKNREVRRVLEYLGLQVSRLIRIAYGPFVLADLAPGGVVEVRQNDLVDFRKTLR